MRLRTIAAVAAAVAALAGCGEAPEDQARDDGKDVGQAVRGVADASSVDEMRQAIEELRTAVNGLDGDTRERVQSQVETQRDEIAKGVDEAVSSGNLQDAQQQLKSTAQTLRSQADSFRDSNNSIANEFWRGFEEGYDGD